MNEKLDISDFLDFAEGILKEEDVMFIAHLPEGKLEPFVVSNKDMGSAMNMILLMHTFKKVFKDMVQDFDVRTGDIVYLCEGFIKIFSSYLKDVAKEVIDERGSDKGSSRS